MSQIDWHEVDDGLKWKAEIAGWTAWVLKEPMPSVGWGYTGRLSAPGDGLIADDHALPLMASFEQVARLLEQRARALPAR